MGPGRDLAGRYLRRTRQIRSAGFILGGAVVPLAWLAWTRSVDRLSEVPFWPTLITCYAGAVLLAELLRPRLPAGSMVATEPRNRYTYVPSPTPGPCPA